MKIYACPKCDCAALEQVFGGEVQTCFLCLDCDMIFKEAEAMIYEAHDPPEGAVEVGMTFPPYDVDTD